MNSKHHRNYGSQSQHKQTIPADLRYGQVYNKNEGLPNIGNSCFLNCALQFLYASLSLRSFVENLQQNYTGTQPLSIFLKHVFNGIKQKWQYWKKYELLENVIRKISSLDDEYRYLRQDDSFRLILLILNQLVQQRPQIKQIFSIYYKYLCPVCRNCIKITDFVIVNQNLQCNKCNANMELQLISAPTNIIFKNQDDKEEKTFKAVRKAFYQYRLKAKIIYSGSGRFGHYRTVRKKDGSKQFYVFDDSFVQNYSDYQRFQFNQIQNIYLNNYQYRHRGYSKQKGTSSNAYKNDGQDYYSNERNYRFKKCVLVLYQKCSQKKTASQVPKNNLQQCFEADYAQNLKKNSSKCSQTPLKIQQKVLRDKSLNSQIVKQHGVTDNHNFSQLRKQENCEKQAKEKQVNEIVELVKKVKDFLRQSLQIDCYLKKRKKREKKSQLLQLLKGNQNKQDSLFRQLAKKINIQWQKRNTFLKSQQKIQSVLNFLLKQYDVQDIFKYQLVYGCSKNSCKNYRTQKKLAASILDQKCESCSRKFSNFYFNKAPSCLLFKIDSYNSYRKSQFLKLYERNNTIKYIQRNYIELSNEYLYLFDLDTELANQSLNNEQKMQQMYTFTVCIQNTDKRSPKASYHETKTLKQVIENSGLFKSGFKDQYISIRKGINIYHYANRFMTIKDLKEVFNGWKNQKQSSSSNLITLKPPPNSLK